MKRRKRSTESSEEKSTGKLRKNKTTENETERRNQREKETQTKKVKEKHPTDDVVHFSLCILGGGWGGFPLQVSYGVPAKSTRS